MSRLRGQQKARLPTLFSFVRPRQDSSFHSSFSFSETLQQIEQVLVSKHLTTQSYAGQPIVFKLLMYKIHLKFIVCISWSTYVLYLRGTSSLSLPLACLISKSSEFEYHEADLLPPFRVRIKRARIQSITIFIARTKWDNKFFVCKHPSAVKRVYA